MGKQSNDKKLADIFLDHSLKVKKHDRLVIMTSDFSYPELLQECYKGALQRGAHVYLDVAGVMLVRDRTSVCNLAKLFYENAQDHHLDKIPSIIESVVGWGNKFLALTAIQDPNHLKSIKTDKIQRNQRSYSKVLNKMINKKWVLTYLPTQGYAKQAGMSLKLLERFYYQAVLVDYRKMEDDLASLLRVINRGKTVYIKGYKTNLRLGIAGRSGKSCFGHYNIPDGEVFTGPEETKTEGYIYYDFPGLYAGKVIEGIYLEFKKGKVVKFSAKKGKRDLAHILNTDPGACRFGEFAIGANYSIKKYMYNVLFDEKMGGTIHTALGKSYEDKIGWGRNKSAIHWDIVKDTRKKGSQVWIDDTLVIKEGEILV